MNKALIFIHRLMRPIQPFLPDEEEQQKMFSNKVRVINPLFLAHIESFFRENFNTFNLKQLKRVLESIDEIERFSEFSEKVKDKIATFSVKDKKKGNEMSFTKVSRSKDLDTDDEIDLDEELKLSDAKDDKWVK